MSNDPNIPSDFSANDSEWVSASGSSKFDGTVNVPFAGELHPDFPSRTDLWLLLDIRDMIEQRVEAMGIRSVSAGCGVGGADIGFALGDRTLAISISIREPVTNSP